MRNAISIFFTLLVFTSLNGGATEIDFEQYFSRYLDEVGEGTLTEGQINDQTKIEIKVVEKDACAGRLALRDENQLNFEFDFLSFASPIPDRFTLNNAQFDESNPEVTMMQSPLKLDDSLQICKQGERAIETSSQLFKRPNSIAINWIQTCETADGLKKRYRELLCELK